MSLLGQQRQCITSAVSKPPNAECCQTSVPLSQTAQGTSWLHVIFPLLLIELTFLLCCCILVLLVLRDEIVHIAFGFCKLHLVHALTCVPVEERLTPKHGCEILGHTLEHLLDCRGVPCKGNGHFQALRWNVTNRGLDIV